MDEIEKALNDIRILNNVRLKFKSGNEIPVPEARVTRQEWEAIDRILHNLTENVIDLESKLDRV